MQAVLRLLLPALCLPAVLHADVFTIADSSGKARTLEARIVGDARGALALETADGRIELVAQGAVRSRTPKDGPQPLSTDAMIEQLTERFGKDRFRAYDYYPYVIGVVLSAPLDKKSETRTRSFLRKAGTFFKRVDTVFLDFARSMRLKTKRPRHPLVVLVFETDDDFNEYANKITGGRSLSASRIAGFYSGITNYLAIRLNECHTFEVPLHEAIHQQVYNRQVFQRLAAIPAWFNEGIATGFEGNGEKISIGPRRINANYARRSRSAGLVSWRTIVSEDSAFRGDVLAGDAYTHAWCMHWLLVTKYKDEYTDYVKLLAKKKPLVADPDGQRTAEFRKAFGKTPDELQKEFPTALAYGLRRQKLPPEKPERAGVSVTQTNLGEVVMTAVNRNGTLIVDGTLKNISPLRDMAFYITVETSAGTYADWYLPVVKTSRTLRLQRQTVRKLMRGGSGGYARTFRVRVKAAVPDGEPAKAWKAGRFPVPVFGG